MTGEEEVEIIAAAFLTMTGHFYPDKVTPKGSCPASDQERIAEFVVWERNYGPCIRAMIQGFKRVMGGGKS